MKKIIAIVTIGASTAFLQVQAQESPQSEGTQADVIKVTQNSQAAEAKTEIEKSELPKEVMESFEKSEYSNMDIVTIYEVKSTEDSGEEDFKLMADDNEAVIPAITEESAEEIDQQADEASNDLESAANQAEQSAEEATVGIEQDAEKVAEETKEATSDVSGEVEKQASEFAEDTQETASEEAAQKPEGSVTETATTEEVEETGQVIAAETPEEEPATTESTKEEKMGKKLYEQNQYDSYTDANHSAYEEVAESQIDNSTKNRKTYELQVKGDDREMKLTYDENGELVKADKGSM